MRTANADNSAARMLHAELRHKLDLDSDALSRSEDVLTSTVFGTLFVADALEILRVWLAPHQTSDADPTGRSSRIDYWFWPRLSDSEPDLLLRIEETLFAIEVKYDSGAHDLRPEACAALDGDGQSHLTTQLAREWWSCHPHNPACPTYPSSIRSVIEDSGGATLLYLVKSSRANRALADIERARTELIAKRSVSPNEIGMHVVTWEQLFRVLAVRTQQQANSARWMLELLGLLASRRLAPFIGFRSQTPRLSARESALLSRLAGADSEVQHGPFRREDLVQLRRLRLAIGRSNVGGANPLVLAAGRAGAELICRLAQQSRVTPRISSVPAAGGSALATFREQVCLIERLARAARCLRTADRTLRKPCEREALQRILPLASFVASDKAGIDAPAPTFPARPRFQSVIMLGRLCQASKGRVQGFRSAVTAANRIGIRNAIRWSRCMIASRKWEGLATPAESIVK